MNKCENCGIEIINKYVTSNRFCSQKCLKSFSTKISRTLTKQIICTRCNLSVRISKSSNKKVCESCNKLIQKEHCLFLKEQKRKPCQICGDLICENAKICGTRKLQKLTFLNTLVKYFGFNKDVIGTKEVYNEYFKIRDMLYFDYWESKLSSCLLEKKYGYKNVCRHIFKYMNIPTRSLSDARHLSLKFNRDNFPVGSVTGTQYKHGWHTTWNNKEIFYRSSHELEYAKELDVLNIDYEVEGLRIEYIDSVKNKNRIAIPDFYIPSENLIVEIKSTYTLDKQNMLDKFKAYRNLGYTVKLILDKKEVVDFI